VFRRTPRFLLDSSAKSAENTFVKRTAAVRPADIADAFAWLSQTLGFYAAFNAGRAKQFVAMAVYDYRRTTDLRLLESNANGVRLGA
jgi:hypothetical protein